MMKEDLVAFLDTETGGVTPGVDPVIEVATIVTDLAFKEIDRIEMKVKLRPGEVVSPGAAAVNGYTPEKWADARPFGEYVAFLKRAVPFGHSAIPVGHNVQFDLDMLRKGYFDRDKIFFPFSYRAVDTLVLARTLSLAGLVSLPDHKLTTVTKALGIRHEGAHGAMSDCEAARDVFLKVVDMLKGAAEALV